MNNQTDSDFKANSLATNSIPTINLHKTEEEIPITLPIVEKVNPFFVITFIDLCNKIKGS